MKLVPMLPTKDISEQTDFYQTLGFEVIAVYTRPNPYGVVSYKELELHFFGNKKHIAEENPMITMVKFNSIEELESINRLFINNLKAKHGKVPRTGIPRISAIKELHYDFRFNMTDNGRNHFYFIAEKKGEEPAFFREVAHLELRHNYELLYDLLYSKMDVKAANLLMKRVNEQLGSTSNLTDIDRVKFLLLKLVIAKEEGEDHSNIAAQIEKLIKSNNRSQEWERVHNRYLQALEQD